MRKKKQVILVLALMMKNLIKAHQKLVTVVNLVGENVYMIFKKQNYGYN